MPGRQYCADKLFLLGETFDAAAQYIDLCDAVLNEEDVSMVQLAYEQISPLKNRAARLGQKLEELEKRVANKLVQLTQPTGLKTQPKRRSARGASA
jgi:hypothetical protein